MKKLLLVLFVIVGIAGLGRVYYMKAALQSRYSLEDLRDIATEANKSLPAMVDQQTRLDAVVASEHLLEKRFTLVSAQTSDALINELSTRLGPVIKAQSCQNKQSMNLYESGVSEAFSYFDMNGKHIATFTVNKSSCG